MSKSSIRLLGQATYTFSPETKDKGNGVHVVVWPDNAPKKFSDRWSIRPFSEVPAS